MLNIVSSNRFKKDLKLVLRRGYRIELLEEVVNKLADGIVLEYYSGLATNLSSYWKWPCAIFVKNGNT